MRKGIDFDVRPIPSRLLKSLADCVRPDLGGSSVLDLFAGKGTMGFRLFEEGADRLVLVERAPDLVREMATRARAMDGNISVVGQDVFTFLASYSGDRRFDFVLLDPPFPLWDRRGFADRLYDALSPFVAHLRQDSVASPGRLVIKSPAHRLPPDSICGLSGVKSSKVGDSQLVHYMRKT